MKSKRNPLILALAFMLAVSAFSVPVYASELRTADNPLLFTRNTIDKYGGFDFELWRDKGEAQMSLTGGGTFECAWDRNETGNILFRTGKKFDRSKTHEELGEITIDYAAEFKILEGDVAYLCMYGWTVDPLVEFYVVENFGNYRPPGGKGLQGEVEIDGAVYEVFMDTRVNQPSILGTQTFPQYFAVRKTTDRVSEGIISVSEHFRSWEEMGLEMGKMSEVALCVEGFRSSGYANVYRHIMTVGDNVFGEPYDSWLQYPPEGTDEPDDAEDEPQPEPEPEPIPEPAGDLPSEEEDSDNTLLFVLLGIGGVIVVCAVIAIVVKSKTR